MISENDLCYYRIARDERCLRDCYQRMRNGLNIYSSGMKFGSNCLELNLSLSNSLSFIWLLDLFEHDNDGKAGCKKRKKLMAAPGDHKIKIQRELVTSIVE